ncbi:MAG: KpsF/GutQ family sugar-phosphate isomerase [Alphaproteobacteria bacterium]
MTTGTKELISDLAVARRVLEDEARGLSVLAAALDEKFVRAVDLMAKTSGRVIVSGMGKSGHVANKIAATMASTGTPAQYVNAGEASHGDLGMITKGDMVLALSNSGETPELSDLVAHCEINDIPLVGLVGRAGSSLDRAADVSLVLPDIAEACPLNLAPTTSTTAMMALGDALAVALLERQDFSPDDFNALHPGGQLGRRFIKVCDIMHDADAMPMVDEATPMGEVLLTMTAKSFGCVGIVDADGMLAGIITDGDLRRHIADPLLELCAGEVMTPVPLTIGTDTLAAAALKLMNENKVTALFVVKERRPVGILHIHDLLRAGIV